MTFEHRTSGGKFDPAEEYCYFLATSTGRHTEAMKALPEENLHLYEHVLVAVNEIKSPADMEDLTALIEERKVLIDSGIFNLATSHAKAHGMTMDEALTLAPEEVDGFSALYDLYCGIATRFKDQMWGMIELDLGGPLVKPETRKRIVKDTGITPIPVIHPRSDGWDYYDDHADAYDRICVGNLVKAVGTDRARLIHALSERARTKHPNTWHHLLGVTPNPQALAIPVRGSSDSSTWLNGVRWLQSWRTGAMTVRTAAFPESMYYRTAAEAGITDGHGSYYRVDGVALASSFAMQQAVRDVRREYGFTP